LPAPLDLTALITYQYYPI